MEGVFDQIISKLNQALANSQIPLRAEKFCSERADVVESVAGKPWTEVVDRFIAIKGSPERLRGSADTALLIVQGISGSGVTTNGGVAVAGGGVNCYDVLRHEVGHTFGGMDPGAPHRPGSDYARGYTRVK